MCKSAALASWLIAGFACLAGGAAVRLTGVKPKILPASNPPRTAMCRSFTLSPFSKSAQDSTGDADAGYALLAILPQGRTRNFARLSRPFRRGGTGRRAPGWAVADLRRASLTAGRDLIWPSKNHHP